MAEFHRVSLGVPFIYESLSLPFPGNNTFFRQLLNSGLFDPDVVDGSGNGLLHLVAFGKCSKRKCEVIYSLLGAGANPTLKNTEGKMPVDYLVKKDPRTRLIRTAMNSFKAAKKSGGAKKIKKVVETPEKNVVPQDNAGQEDDEPDWCQMAEDEVENDEPKRQVVKAKDKKPIPSTPPVIKDPLDVVRVSVSDLIDSLCPENVLQNEDGTGEDSDSQSKNETVGEATKDTGQDQETIVHHIVPDIERIEVDVEDNDSNDEDMELDLECPFEDLPWEVDCTDQFWKALQNNKASDVLKRRIVTRIRMLAEGRWTKKLCRRLDSQSKKTQYHVV